MSENLMDKLEDGIKRMGTSTTLGEVFEYCAMLAATASSSTSTGHERQVAIRDRMLKVAASALAVLRNGDASCGLKPEDGWFPCTHSVAIQRFREGTYIRGAHWNGVSACLENDIIKARMADGSPVASAVMDRIRDELLSNRVDGAPIAWWSEDEEIPF